MMEFHKRILLPHILNDDHGKDDVNVYVNVDEDFHAELVLSPTSSPCTYTLLGFGSSALRQFADLLNEAAEEIERKAKS